VNHSKLDDKETHMNDVQSSSHTKWDCKYHVVFIAKYRRKWAWGHLSVAA